MSVGWGEIEIFDFEFVPSTEDCSSTVLSSTRVIISSCFISFCIL